MWLCLPCHYESGETCHIRKGRVCIEVNGTEFGFQLKCKWLIEHAICNQHELNDVIEVHNYQFILSASAMTVSS